MIIHQNHVKALARHEDLQCFHAISGQFTFYVFIAQHVLKNHAVIRIIVHNQYPPNIEFAIIF